MHFHIFFRTDYVILILLFGLFDYLIMFPPHSLSRGKLNSNAYAPFKSEIITNIFYAFVCIFGIVTKPVANPTLFDYVLLIISLTGVIIRFKAYNDLAPFYFFEIGISKDHIIIDNGLYKFLAHPGYLGTSMVMISTIIFINLNVYFTMIFSCAILFMFINRAFAEEKMLIDHFGDNYRYFLSTRKRFIPYIF